MSKTMLTGFFEDFSGELIQSQPESDNFYLYKDKFLSGWGLGIKGSYVISTVPVDRPEFKLLAESDTMDAFKFAYGKDRNFQLWVGKPRSKEFKKYSLEWVSKNKPLKIVRQEYPQEKR